MTDKKKVVYTMDDENDEGDGVFKWTITFGDGRKEKFEGTAEQAFDHAYAQEKRFAVEKDPDQDEEENE